MSPDVKLGFALAGNFGGTLKYDNNWVGRYYVQETWILGISFLPSIAWKVNDKLSLGACLNAMYGIYNNNVAINNVDPLFGDGRLKLKTKPGAGAAIWDCSTKSTPDSARPHLELAGRPGLQCAARVHGLAPGLSAALDKAGLLNSNLKVGIKVPQQVMGSLFTQVDDRWAVLGSVGWQQWSKFGQVQIGIDDTTNPTSTTTIPFKDTWHLAAGAQYRLSDPWLLNFGIAYDSASSRARVSPLLPVNSAWRFGVGGQHQLARPFTGALRRIPLRRNAQDRFALRSPSRWAAAAISSARMTTPASSSSASTTAMRSEVAFRTHTMGGGHDVVARNAGGRRSSHQRPVKTATRRRRDAELFAALEQVPVAAMRLLRCLAAALTLCLVAASAFGQNPEHPLQAPDRSSPRATLKTFLDGGDVAATYLSREYLPSPSFARFHRLLSYTAVLRDCLDLGEVPAAARLKTGGAAATALYEVLSRIPLPPFDEIPDATQLKQPAGKEPVRWVIPNTEIALTRVSTGPRAGEFLFDTETVARAGEFYERVRELPYVRPVPLKGVYEIFAIGGGWMVPHAWIAAMPAFLRDPIAGEAVWKWIGLLVLLVVVSLLLWRIAYRVSLLGERAAPVPAGIGSVRAARLGSRRRRPSRPILLSSSST